MKTINVEREVQKENALRQIYNDKIRFLKPVLVPFVGRKIRKADGDLVKALKELVIFDKNIKIKPLTPDGYASLQTCYLKADKYGLYLTLSICFSGGTCGNKDYYCDYKCYNYTIGEIKDYSVLGVFNYYEMPFLNAEAERKQYDKVVGMVTLLEKEMDKLWYGVKPGRWTDQ